MPHLVWELLPLLSSIWGLSRADPSSPEERDRRLRQDSSSKDPYESLSPLPASYLGSANEDFYQDWNDGGTHDRGYGQWEMYHPKIWEFAPINPTQAGLPVNPTTSETILTNINNKEMLALEKAYAAGIAPRPMNKAAERVERNAAREISSSSGVRKHTGLLSRLARGSGSGSGSKANQEQESTLVRQGSYGRSSSGGSSRGSSPPQQGEETFYSPQRQSFNRGEFNDASLSAATQPPQGTRYNQGWMYGQDSRKGLEGYNYGQQQGYMYGQGGGQGYGGMYGYSANTNIDEGHRTSVHSQYGQDNPLDPLQQHFLQGTTQAMSGMGLGDYSGGGGGGGMGGLFDMFNQRGVSETGNTGHRQSIDVRGGEYEQQYEWANVSAEPETPRGGEYEQQYEWANVSAEPETPRGGKRQNEEVMLQFTTGKQKYQKKERKDKANRSAQEKEHERILKAAKAMLKQKMKERGTPLDRGALDYRFTRNQNDRINHLIFSKDESEVQEALDAYNNLKSSGYNMENRKPGMMSRKTPGVQVGTDGLCAWARKSGEGNIKSLLGQILALEHVPPAGPDRDAAMALWTPLVLTRTTVDNVRAIRSPDLNQQRAGLLQLVDEDYAQFLQRKWMYWDTHPQ